MTRKIKPPRFMWATYETGNDGKLWFRNTGSTKQSAIKRAEIGIGLWKVMTKTGWIVVKYVVAS